MSSRYYHILILGEPKVNVSRVLQTINGEIKRFKIVQHEIYASNSSLVPHTHIALELREPRLPIWLSKRFKVKLMYIELCHSSLIFEYLQ